MLLIYNFNEYIFERYGRNDISKILSEEIYHKINSNLGKLILNKELTFSIDDIQVGEMKFQNSVINVFLSNRFYGNTNVKHTIIKNDTINNLVINLEMMLTRSEYTAKTLFDNKINETIVHECLHVIENYLTKSDNKVLAKSWDYDEKLKHLQTKYKNDKEWQNISYFIYLSLPHELRARTNQLNQEIENNYLNGIKNVQKFIKTTKIYKDILFLSKINTDLLLNKLKTDENYSDIIQDFSIYFLESDNPNYENNFIKYINRMKKKCHKMISILLRSSYNFESYETDCNIDRDIIYDDYL